EVLQLYIQGYGAGIYDEQDWMFGYRGAQGDLDAALAATFDPSAGTGFNPGTDRNTREYMALMSLMFNGRSLVRPSNKLVNAIADNDRAEAWFQIRYGSNGLATKKMSGVALSTDDQKSYAGGIDKGIANRRIYEAALFGLYDT